jgi:hypothetical protein
LLIATKKNEIFKYIYDDANSLRQSYQVPNEKAQIYKVFVDQKGHHIFITMQYQTSKLNYYCNNKTLKFKELTKLKDFAIESIAFDDNKSTEFSTDVLI